MLKFILYLALITLFSIYLSAQNSNVDKVKYDLSFKFKDGLYLSHLDFLNNSPIEFERLVNPDFNNPDFFSKFENSKIIVFNDQYGNIAEKQLYEIWGYSRNGKPYVFWGGKFNMIPYIGKISHFVAMIRVMYDNRTTMYDPYYYRTSPGIYYRDEIVQLLLDNETGIIADFNIKNTEIFLERDTDLYNEFKRLRKRKKNKMMFYYIRQYNERNPLYLPQN